MWDIIVGKKLKCDEEVQDASSGQIFKAPITIYLLDNHWYHLYICICTLFIKDRLALYTVGPELQI